MTKDRAQKMQAGRFLFVWRDQTHELREFMRKITNTKKAPLSGKREAIRFVGNSPNYLALFISTSGAAGASGASGNGANFGIFFSLGGLESLVQQQEVAPTSHRARTTNDRMRDMVVYWFSLVFAEVAQSR